MSSYKKEFLDSLVAENAQVILEDTNGDVYAGYMTKNIFGHYDLLPFTHNGRHCGLPASMIKRIVYFTGVVPCKNWTPNSQFIPKKINKINLIELSELLNKAGYSFC